MFRILVAFLGIILASPSLWALKNNERRLKAEEAIRISVNNYREKCQSSLDVKANFEESVRLKLKETDQPKIMETFGRSCSSAIYAIAKLCEQSLYKREFAKVSKLRCEPEVINEQPKGRIQRNDDQITIFYHPTAGGVDFSKILREGM